MLGLLSDSTSTACLGMFAPYTTSGGGKTDWPVWWRGVKTCDWQSQQNLMGLDRISSQTNKQKKRGRKIHPYPPQFPSKVRDRCWGLLHFCGVNVFSLKARKIHSFHGWLLSTLNSVYLNLQDSHQKRIGGMGEEQVYTGWGAKDGEFDFGFAVWSAIGAGRQCHSGTQLEIRVPSSQEKSGPKKVVLEDSYILFTQSFNQIFKEQLFNTNYLWDTVPGPRITKWNKVRDQFLRSLWFLETMDKQSNSCDIMSIKEMFGVYSRVPVEYKEKAPKVVPDQLPSYHFQ